MPAGISVCVRPVLETDLDETDRIFRVAFGSGPACPILLPMAQAGG